MNLNDIKQAVCKFLFLVETAALFILLSAAIQGTLSVPEAIGYAVFSFVGVNLLSCLILPAEEELRPRAQNTRSALPTRHAVPLRVVHGGRHVA